jgi:hypothetical protein
LIIPVFGPFVAMAGSLWAAYQVARIAYAESDWFKVLVVGVVAMVPAAVATWVLALALGFISRPVLALDPMQPLLASLAERAVAGPLEPGTTGGDANGDQRQAAAAPVPASRAEPEARPLHEQIARSVARPAAAPAAKVRATGAGASPAAAFVPPATPVAAGPEAQAVASPVPQPTSVAGAVAKEVGIEAAKQGVNQAAKLLRLF